MSVDIKYRKLNTAGDTLSWVAIERTLYTDWGNGLGPVLGAWHGVVALGPTNVSGGCG